MGSSNSITNKVSLSPGMLWLIAFVPALGYFLSTRLLSGSGNDMGTLLTNHIKCSIQVVPTTTTEEDGSNSFTDLSSSCCETYQSLYHIKNRCDSYKNDDNSNNRNINTSLELTLKYGLMNVLTISTGGAQQRGIIDMQWIHDEEIGRGYLLYSTGNQIWRWERGGGPIPIGRTLHLDNAGCRSNIYQQCNNNDDEEVRNSYVGAITTSQEIQRYKNDNNKQIISKIPATKELTIAEWGEQRIVRFENEIGARTPLIFEIPNVCTATKTTITTTTTNDKQQYIRLHPSSPERMVYTPTGNLLLVHNIICDEEVEIEVVEEEEQEIVDHREAKEVVVDTDVSSDESSSTARTERIIVSTKKKHHTSVIIQLNNAVHIPALPNLQESRIAHSWTTMNYTTLESKYELTPPTIFWHPESSKLYKIYGIELNPTGESIYISVQYTNRTMSILEFSLLEDVDDDDNNKDDDDDDNEEKKEKTETSTLLVSKQPKVLYDISSIVHHHHHGHSHNDTNNKYQIGDFVVTPSGTIIVAINDVVNNKDSYLLTILHHGKEGTSMNQKKQGQVPVPPVSIIPLIDDNNSNGSTNKLIKDGIITALELGTDGYLYVAISSVLVSNSYSLNRIRIKEKVTW